MCFHHPPGKKPWAVATGISDNNLDVPTRRANPPTRPPCGGFSQPTGLFGNIQATHSCQQDYSMCLLILMKTTPKLRRGVRQSPAPRQSPRGSTNTPTTNPAREGANPPVWLPLHNQVLLLNKDKAAGAYHKVTRNMETCSQHARLPSQLNATLEEIWKEMYPALPWDGLQGALSLPPSGFPYLVLFKAGRLADKAQKCRQLNPL